MKKCRKSLINICDLHGGVDHWWNIYNDMLRSFVIFIWVLLTWVLCATVLIFSTVKFKFGSFCIPYLVISVCIRRFASWLLIKLLLSKWSLELLILNLVINSKFLAHHQSANTGTYHYWTVQCWFLNRFLGCWTY